MERQFVTLDIAVKLKKMGFDDGCLARYEYRSSVDMDIIVLEITPIEGQCTFSWQVASAPLWQQVFDWFRNKKVLIEVSAIDSWDYWSATIYMEDFMSPFFVAFQDNEYEAKTYEEAREYAILKAIDLITK